MLDFESLVLLRQRVHPAVQLRQRLVGLASERRIMVLVNPRMVREALRERLRAVTDLSIELLDDRVDLLRVTPELLSNVTHVSVHARPHALDSTVHTLLRHHHLVVQPSPERKVQRLELRIQGLHHVAELVLSRHELG